MVLRNPSVNDTVTIICHGVVLNVCAGMDKGSARGRIVADANRGGVPKIHDVRGGAAAVSQKHLPDDVGLLDAPPPFFQVCLCHAEKVAPGDDLDPGHRDEKSSGGGCPSSGVRRMSLI